MSHYIADPRDPKKLPDPVSGVEANDQITNSEEQQIVDDIVAEPTGNSNNSEEEPGVTEIEKKDITDIN